METQSKTDVVIEEFDGFYSIYNECGHGIEHDFESIEEAKNWAENNNCFVVDNFFYRK